MTMSKDFITAAEKLGVVVVNMRLPEPVLLAGLPTLDREGHVMIGGEFAHKAKFTPEGQMIISKEFIESLDADSNLLYRDLHAVADVEVAFDHRRGVVGGLVHHPDLEEIRAMNLARVDRVLGGVSEPLIIMGDMSGSMNADDIEKMKTMSLDDLKGKGGTTMFVFSDGEVQKPKKKKKKKK